MWANPNFRALGLVAVLLFAGLAHLPKFSWPVCRARLLTERFKLTLHHEQREIPHFALVVDKKGSKLPQATNTDNASSEVRQGRIVVQGVSIATPIVLLGRYH